MSEERLTTINNEEILEDNENQEELHAESNDLQEEIDPKEAAREEVFENLKNGFMEQRRLLGRFLEFSEEHAESEFDEMGASQEESAEILRRADKIRDKILVELEQKYLYIFENIETNTLLNMIIFYVDSMQYRFKVILEVEKDGFNLEVI
jgi:hypothetical protein